MAIAFSAQAAVPDSREKLLVQLGEKASRFWDQFSVLTCTEVVDQKKLEITGKEILSRRATFDYLILLQMQGDDLLVEESRILQGKAAKDSDRALLSTKGFSTMLLIFHPIFQPSYRFEDAGMVVSAGKLYRQIRFTHIEGQRSPSVLQIRQRDYPVRWKGIAWIDVEGMYVARIESELRESMPDIGLEKLRSDVRYLPTRLPTAKFDQWLPRTAVVELATKRQRWLNSHSFNAYRQFSVDTSSKTEMPPGSATTPKP
ncbi:MAG: hypothetical protein NTW74_11785 [Acidobacteria bacterium]|nr:hypothetical protein [Acidobacteriota bacterium]